MGLSQRDQTKHNTLLRLGTQSVKKVSIPNFFDIAITRFYGVSVDSYASVLQFPLPYPARRTRDCTSAVY